MVELFLFWVANDTLRVRTWWGDSQRTEAGSGGWRDAWRHEGEVRRPTLASRPWVLSHRWRGRFRRKRVRATPCELVVSVGRFQELPLKLLALQEPLQLLLHRVQIFLKQCEPLIILTRSGA